MATNKKGTGHQNDKNGRVMVGKLRRDKALVADLSGSEQRRIKGGAPQPKPRTRGSRHGGDCDEFGCGTNHNETLVRAT